MLVTSHTLCPSPWTGAVRLSMRFWFDRGLLYNTESLLKTTCSAELFHLHQDISNRGYSGPVTNTAEEKENEEKLPSTFLYKLIILSSLRYPLHIFTSTTIRTKWSINFRREKSRKNVYCLKEKLNRYPSKLFQTSKLLHVASWIRIMFIPTAFDCARF